MLKIGKRFTIDSETLYTDLNGLGGIVLGQIDAVKFRVALDNGMVKDLPGIILNTEYSDGTQELTRPPLPDIQDEAEQDEASRQTARVYELFEAQRLQILEIEAQIKAAQDDLARQMRGDYFELYESQRVTGAVFSEMEKRIQAGAMAIWQSKGRPAKGKTYGAAQIAEERTVSELDADAALAYARTQAPNLITTAIDEKRFKKAVLSGTLVNVPEAVCKVTTTVSAKTLTARLSKLSDSES